MGARRRRRAVGRLAKCGGGSRPVVATSEREGLAREGGSARTRAEREKIKQVVKGLFGTLGTKVARELASVCLLVVTCEMEIGMVGWRRDLYGLDLEPMNFKGAI